MFGIACLTGEYITLSMFGRMKMKVHSEQIVAVLICVIMIGAFLIVRLSGD